MPAWRRIDQEHLAPLDAFLAENACERAGSRSRRRPTMITIDTVGSVSLLSLWRRAP